MMSPQTENALRAVACKCRSDILAALEGKPRSERDGIITAILDRHAKTIDCLPPNTFRPKAWLIHYVRRIDKEMRTAK
ncbi:hypothetical protein [Type-D symbiont of Plautia stali]|uniref:hypothetical protein n=1 Tax=Type-D symbiont of Plautia stali TaxID=1560356 RepID=UPI001F181C85|nr:hypothetical protein [Type-D symbiont of Plautia stali]